MWRECERCVRLLAKEGIASSTTTASTTSADAPSPTFGSASFRHWARRNHPDKGGDVARFQDVSRCCKAVHEERCVEKMKRERDFYRSTRRYTSSTANANGHVPGGGADDDDDDFTAQVFDHMIRDIALCGWSLAQSLGAIYVDVPVAPPVVRRRAQSSRRSVLGVKPVHLRVSVDGLLGPIDFFSPLHEVELGLSFPEGKQVRLDAVGVRWNLNKRGFKRRDKVSEDAKRASRASATVAPAAQTEGVSKANADLALAEEKKVEENSVRGSHDRCTNHRLFLPSPKCTRSARRSSFCRCARGSMRRQFGPRRHGSIRTRRVGGGAVRKLAFEHTVALTCRAWTSRARQSHSSSMPRHGGSFRTAMASEASTTVDSRRSSSLRSRGSSSPNEARCGHGWPSSWRVVVTPHEMAAAR